MAEDNEYFRQIYNGVTVEWKIKDFSDKCDYYENGECIQSPLFKTIFNWRILLYPNGIYKEQIGKISLFLKKIDDTKHTSLVSVSFLVKVENLVVFDRKFKYNFEKYTSYGCPSFAEKQEIVKSLISPDYDCLTVVCTVRPVPSLMPEILPNEIIFRDNSAEVLANNLKDLFVSKKFSDVTFKVDSEDYPAHKNILAARSPVFLSMFEHEMAEKVNGVVEIVDSDSACFKIFLEFLYTGNLDNPTVENVIGVYKLADKYCVSGLKERCCNLLYTGLKVDTILDVIELATVHEEKKLLTNAVNFFTIHATDILVTEKWQKFNVEKCSISNSLLKEMAIRSIIRLKQEISDEDEEESDKK